ncbi:MAG TPA: hemerythrin domain-containing protein [Candidatus Saccharimonadales bacterium]|nr:hemerythrin domain-containing protein [Candidatus Saccharimonadales bacterium]
MIATQTLRHEHEAILKMLDAAEEVSRRLRERQAVEPDVLDGLLEFFREFADRCHHGKEEEALFPLLEERGVPRTGGPIGVMLQEHDQGRALIAEMVEAASAYRRSEADAGARWAGAAAGYAQLLRGHIEKENNILFVMAERLLSPNEQKSLADRFEAIERDKMGEGTHQRLHAKMEELASTIWGRTAAR